MNSPANTTASLDRKPRPNTGMAVHRFRNDIQGLRAVAVLGVLLFHIESSWLTGGFAGVDIFFVISGYLITGLLIKEIVRTGKVSLGDFYARRVRRILPAATVTVIVTLLVGAVVLPTSQVTDLASTAFFAAIALANWSLARDTNDYFASDSDASALQHFWSLAVEEQFYFVWPLLVIAVTMLVGLWKTSRDCVDARRVAGAVLIASVAIFLPSLIHSIHLTAINPGPAYFITTTRAWELSVGTALAAIVVLVRRPIDSRVSRFMVLAGGAMILATYVAFTGTTPFPSGTALLPVVGSALVILGGAFDDGRSIIGLDRGPMVLIGDLSYSLYLVHWPMLTFLNAVYPGAPLWANLAMGALSIPVAILLRHGIEIPFMKMKKAQVRTVLAAGAACVASSVLVSVGVGSYSRGLTDREERQAQAAESQVDGALAVIRNGQVTDPMDSLDDVDVIVPAPSSADEDKSPINLDDCQASPNATVVKECHYGDENSETVLVLVGDSHASHWSSALVPIVEDQGWHLVTMTKGRCPVAAGAPVLGVNGEEVVSTECTQWNNSVKEKIPTFDPTMVITSTSLYTLNEGEDFSTAMARTWKELTAQGIPVTVLIDTPRSAHDLPLCVQSNPDDLSKCATDATPAEAGSGAPSQRAALEQAPGVQSIDLSKYICPGTECAPVVGGALVYFDTGHMTQTFASTLAEPLANELIPLVDDVR